jgi:LacI family transcriptional regulator
MKAARLSVSRAEEESDAFSIPSLSVVYLPMEEMARECIQLVLGQLDGRIATAESRLLPIEYVPRESCGPLTEYAAQ